MQITIIVPVYNEEKSVQKTIDRLKKVSKKMRSEIVIVNDGSTDKTATIIQKNRGIHFINCHKNSGYGSAIKNALSRVETGLVAITDADNTYKIEDIPLMVQELKRKNADLVIGSRFMKHIPQAMPPVNRVGNILLSLLTSILTRTSITDTTSGLRVFNTQKIRKLGIKANGLDYALEMSVKAAKKGLKIIELPTAYENRDGVSKLKPLEDGAKFLITILRAYFLD